MSNHQTASALAYLNPDFCFIMDDNSMECAGIRAGDIVAFTACDHAENGQIVAVQTDSAVLLLRQICNGELLADAPRTRQEHVIRFDELPGAKIIGRAVEVRHILNGQRKEPTMKRNDLRAMGLTPDQIDTIMTMNGADINREKAKAGQQTDKEVQRLRESCITLLELLDDPKAVRGILLYASRLYSRQERRKSQEGQQ